MMNIIDENYINNLKMKLKSRPYYIFTLENSKKVIHNIQFLIDFIEKKHIKYIKYKNDYIYLIGDNKTYKYAYGYYIKGMENW